MATNQLPNKYTFEEYLAVEEETGLRHEFIDGEIYAMSGGTWDHNTIAMNTGIAIGTRLNQKSCRIVNSDMRTKINDIKYVYPDLSVVCSKPEFADDKETILTNPTLFVEVLFDSTAKYDMRAKAAFYRSLPSLQAYLLIDQSRVHVQLYARQPDSWIFQEFTSLEDVILLEAIGCELPLNEIYRGIEFDEE